MTNVTGFVDHISNQSDRYLFILALAIGGFSVWRSIRYLVSRLDQTQAERQLDLKEIISKQSEVIENNTQAFTQLSISIAELRREIHNN